MNLPFTYTDFINVFKTYNQAVFPAQIIFYIIAAAAIIFINLQKRGTNKIVTAVLSFFWLWIGVVYHITFFSTINKAAYTFGVLSVLQSFLFIHFGIITNKISFRNNKSIMNLVGIFLIIYALIIYPILGSIFGHGYPYSPTFGLPCPTTIFTFGILLFSNKRLPISLLIIPFVWAIIGMGGALNLSIYEDYGLPIAALAGSTLIIIFNRNYKQVSN